MEMPTTPTAGMPTTPTVYNVTLTDSLLVKSDVKLELVETPAVSLERVFAILQRVVRLALKHLELGETVSATEFIRAIPPSERRYPATRTGVADDDFRPWCNDVFPRGWNRKDR